MGIWQYVQLALLLLFALAIVVIVLGVIKNVPKGKKGSYRSSRSGE